jgi:hypothetical protein
MPQTECTQCGSPYEAEPALSDRQMRLKLDRCRSLTLICVVIAVVSFIALWVSHTDPPYEVPYQSTGNGTILYYDPNNHWMLFETDAGFMEKMNVCGQPGIWTHMRANIRFHWSKWEWHLGNMHPDEECYRIDNIHRIGEDAR